MELLTHGGENHEIGDGDWPPPDERSIGDDDGDDFPLPEGSFPGRIAPQEP